MTPSEEAHLRQFLARLVEARVDQKDLQAEQMIAQAFRQQPHAAYLLTQRAMALGVALQVAQRRIRELEESQKDVQPGAMGASAQTGPAGQLGSYGARGGEAASWGRQGYSSASPQTGQFSGSGPARPATQGSWTQGLMGSLVGAAAGVVVGQAIWQGMQSMLADSPAQDLAASGLDASGFGAGASGFTQVADAGGGWDAAGVDEGLGMEGDFGDGDWI